MDVSEMPFPKALARLMHERDVGIRELARATRKHGWGSGPHLSRILHGEQTPTSRGMERIAAALNVAPETFADYRLAKARERLDPRVVGFKTALRNLGE